MGGGHFQYLNQKVNTQLCEVRLNENCKKETYPCTYFNVMCVITAAALCTVYFMDGAFGGRCSLFFGQP